MVWAGDCHRVGCPDLDCDITVGTTELAMMSDEETEENIHIMPLNDTYEHDSSIHCWCNPTPDVEVLTMYIHHSHDRRELKEMN